MDKVSAFMDGELDAHQSDQQYRQFKQDPEARACWDTYHLIGDVLRGERAASGNPAGRLERFRAELEKEPTVLSPQRRPAKRVSTYAWSMAASLSAVAVVGWMAVNNPLAPQAQPEAQRVAQQQPVRPAAVEVEATPAALPNVPSDGRMNEYLMAHQGFSPSTALQGLQPYIRSVSASTTNSKGRE